MKNVMVPEELFGKLLKYHLLDQEQEADDIRKGLEMSDEALEKKDSSSYSNYNQSFHYEIWTAAGNEKLKTMLSEMWNGLSMGLKSTEEEYARNSQEEHRQILAALESGDPKQAGEKMVFHIIRSMNDVLTRY